jgi:hypothetical protein
MPTKCARSKEMAFFMSSAISGKLFWSITVTFLSYFKYMLYLQLTILSLIDWSQIPRYHFISGTIFNIMSEFMSPTSNKIWESSKMETVQMLGSQKCQMFSITPSIRYWSCLPWRMFWFSHFGILYYLLWGPPHTTHTHTHTHTPDL